MVLPHTLEFETDPYAVIREADRMSLAEIEAMWMKAGSSTAPGSQIISSWLRAAIGSR